MEKLSTEELKRHLLTADYKGGEFKSIVLAELLRREWWKFWAWKWVLFKRLWK